MLRAWIEEKYCGRQIRISGEPYFTHLLFVAEMAATEVAFGYEIGLCHDLLEDTGIPAKELYDMLLQFEYAGTDAKFITEAVVELTDVYTRTTYPEMSKKKLEKKETERLSGISSTAQTVKYADLIYNINWTVKYEPAKAKKYLQKKKKLVAGLTGGDPKLHKWVSEAVSEGLHSLNF